MKKKFYTVAVASLAATAVAVAPAAAAGSFTDVAKDNAHFEAITALQKAGVISGYPDGTFKPAQDVTRGQAAKMIAGALGLDTKNVTNPNFADIPTSHQYYGPIAALAALDGIEYYEDNTVEPNEKITREEFAFMLTAGLGIEAQDEIENAEKTITRGEVATFIYSILSSDVEEEEQTTTEDTANVEQTTADTALLETVFTKVTEKQQATTSMKAKMTMTMSMDVQVGEEQETVDMTGTMDMSIINSPMQFFVEGTMSMVEPTTGEAIDMPLKMYMTEKDGMYMYEGMTGTWVKYPTDMFGELLAQSGAQVDVTEQLAMMKKFATDVTIKEVDGHYVLTLVASGDNLVQLVQEQLAGMDLGLDEEMLSEMQNMKFDSFSYEMKINKETFDIEELVMDFGIGMNMEGVAMNIKNTSTTKYFDFNAVTTITIPAEALENAKTLEELMSIELEQQ